MIPLQYGNTETFLTPQERNALIRSFMGKTVDLNDPRLQILEAIGDDYPAAHITTAHHDFLKAHAQPMYDFLTGRGVHCKIDIYGSEEDQTIGHVFHVTINTPEAIRCNDDAAAFFHEVLATE